MTKYICPDCGSLNVLVLDNGDLTADVECEDCDGTTCMLLSELQTQSEGSE